MTTNTAEMAAVSLALAERGVPAQTQVPNRRKRGFATGGSTPSMLFLLWPWLAPGGARPGAVDGGSGQVRGRPTPDV